MARSRAAATVAPAAAVEAVLAAVSHLPAETRDGVTISTGVVAVSPALARAVVAQKSALTRAIDTRHVGALGEAMGDGRWVPESSLVQLHVSPGLTPHLFVADGAHRLAAIAAGRKPVPTLLVVRRFAEGNTAADLGTYDAANSQKAQSLTARAKTIARRSAPEGWTEAETADKAAIRGAMRYGTLVQQGHRFAARRPARNLPMAKVMDAAFAAFPIARALSAANAKGNGPVARLLGSDAVMAFLILAAREGLDAEGFISAALKPGAIQRELSKVAGKRHAGGSGTIVEVQAVAAAFLWHAGTSESEALRSVYQDREISIGNVKARF